MAVKVSHIRSCSLASSIFHSKFNVIFSIKVICKCRCCLLRLLGKSFNVSVCLHSARCEWHPSYTCVSDNSYQYDFFQILLARLLDQETNSREASQACGAAAGWCPPWLPCPGRGWCSVWDSQRECSSLTHLRRKELIPVELSLTSGE